MTKKPFSTAPLSPISPICAAWGDTMRNMFIFFSMGLIAMGCRGERQTPDEYLRTNQDARFGVYFAGPSSVVRHPTYEEFLDEYLADDDVQKLRAIVADPQQEDRKRRLGMYILLYTQEREHFLFLLGLTERGSETERTLFFTALDALILKLECVEEPDIMRLRSVFKEHLIVDRPYSRTVHNYDRVIEYLANDEIISILQNVPEDWRSYPHVRGLIDDYRIRKGTPLSPGNYGENWGQSAISVQNNR